MTNLLYHFVILPLLYKLKGEIVLRITLEGGLELKPSYYIAK